jgi:hypothetical protein
MKAKRRKRRMGKNPTIVLTRPNGRKVKANRTVTMKLNDLRRLVSGARKGKKVRVKARVA